MKDLLKTMLVLALVFASTFIMLNISGILTVDSIEKMLQNLGNADPLVISVVVIGLLFADLMIAVPTLTIAVLAGYFLGWIPGFISVSLGFYCAGITGYSISRRYGWNLIRRIYQDEKRLNGMYEAFARLGPFVLIFCRATPILPEVSSCMAGATHMPFSRYLLLYSLGSLPYALLATYAGSISSLDNPSPAIITALGLSLLLWFVWYFLILKKEKIRFAETIILLKKRNKK